GDEPAHFSSLRSALATALVQALRGERESRYDGLTAARRCSRGGRVPAGRVPSPLAERERVRPCDRRDLRRRLERRDGLTPTLSTSWRGGRSTRVAALRL